MILWFLHRLFCGQRKRAEFGRRVDGPGCFTDIYTCGCGWHLELPQEE